MKITTGRTQLHSAMKACGEQWVQVREVWRDGVAAEFDEHCMIPVQDQVKSALLAMDRLAVVIGQMERECE